mmetsp:Transcript_5394/g.4577  ORF Transcript_5394/g.4577 Transcript_5394/m.4577 type:complete len:254 (-) Transcript_5394:34-795(-)
MSENPPMPLNNYSFGTLDYMNIEDPAGSDTNYIIMSSDAQNQVQYYLQKFAIYDTTSDSVVQNVSHKIYPAYNSHEADFVKPYSDGFIFLSCSTNSYPCISYHVVKYNLTSNEIANLTDITTSWIIQDAFIQNDEDYVLWGIEGIFSIKIEDGSRIEYSNWPRAKALYWNSTHFVSVSNQTSLVQLNAEDSSISILKTINLAENAWENKGAKLEKTYAGPYTTGNKIQILWSGVVQFSINMDDFSIDKVVFDS